MAPGGPPEAPSAPSFRQILRPASTCPLFAQCYTVPIEEAVRCHFSFLAHRLEFLKLMYAAGQIGLVNTRFSELQPKVMPKWSEDERENAYRNAVMVAGTEAVVRMWAERGFRESVDELVELHQYALGLPGKLNGVPD